MQHGTEALVRALLRGGATTIFHAPGSDSLALLPALVETTLDVLGFGSIDAAVHGADGFARTTARPGVVINGRSNIDVASLPSLQEASDAESPLILVQPTVGDDAPETFPTFWLDSKTDPSVIFRAARDRSFTQPCGPVIVRFKPAFLTDFVSEEGGSFPESAAAPKGVEHVQLRRASNLIDASDQTLIWVGGGALRSGAGSAIAELAERLGSPVITTDQAVGVLPARHPCLVALSTDIEEVGVLWDEAETVIAIGASLAPSTTQGGRLPIPKQLISINIDTATGVYQPDVLLRGDARTLTKALADAVGYRGGTGVVRSRSTAITEAVTARMSHEHPNEWAFTTAVTEAIPDTAVCVTDTCTAARWFIAFHEWTLPRSLVTPADGQQIGFAIPAAVGVAAAGTGGPILVVTGDQNALASIGVLSSLTAQNRNVTVLIVNDHGSSTLQAGSTAEAKPLLSAPTPDFAALGTSFGLRSVDATVENLSTVLHEQIEDPEPALVSLDLTLSPAPTDPHCWYRSIEQ